MGPIHFMLWLNLSPSLPIGVYRTVPLRPVRGAIVVVCLPPGIGAFARARGYLGRGPCPGGVERLGKRVAAVAGDTVDVDATGVRVHHVAVANSRPRERDSRGRPLPRMRGRFIVPSGAIFVLATEHPLSFDSRYFGVIPTAGAIVVRPVFVLGAKPDRIGVLEHVPEPLHGERNLSRRDGQTDEDAECRRDGTPAGDDRHADAKSDGRQQHDGQHEQ
jgi:conjugative transfer signal peptidase TraF